MVSVGRAVNRFSVVYAGTGSISTSDERVKTAPLPIDSAVLRAWAKVNYVQYKFTDAVQLKGSSARWHFGLIAQRVKEAFESEGLDAFEYGLLCYDEWEDQVEQWDEWPDEYREVTPVSTDASGRTVPAVFELVRSSGKALATPARAAGTRYGIRYEEALALECAYLRSRLE